MVIVEPFPNTTGTLWHLLRKWGLTDSEMCNCSDIQTMSKIIDSCSLTKRDAGLQRIYTALDSDDDNNNKYCIVIIIAIIRRIAEI